MMALAWLKLRQGAVPIIAGVAVVALCVAAAYLAYEAGRVQGRTECRAAVADSALHTTQEAVQEAKAQTTQDLQRAATTGTTREQQRQAIDAHFAHLAQAAQEIHDDPAHVAQGPGLRADDACTLGADGLRLWAAANAGPFGDEAGAGAPAAQPADATAPAAAPTLGPAAGAGGQPPRGGPAVPPVGKPDVPAPAIPAGPH